jgi:hypothetical protein
VGYFSTSMREKQCVSYWSQSKITHLSHLTHRTRRGSSPAAFVLSADKKGLCPPVPAPGRGRRLPVPATNHHDRHHRGHHHRRHHVGPLLGQKAPPVASRGQVWPRAASAASGSNGCRAGGCKSPPPGEQASAARAGACWADWRVKNGNELTRTDKRHPPSFWRYGCQMCSASHIS